MGLRLFVRIRPRSEVGVPAVAYGGRPTTQLPSKKNWISQQKELGSFAPNSVSKRKNALSNFPSKISAENNCS